MSTAVSPDHDAHAAPANCPNCEAVVSGHFCSNCGQEAYLHHASTREFLHEFIGHYVALEGKLWGTLLRLLFRPGALTNEYIRGRRVRFVQPLRLYLSLSVLFFALMKFTGGFEPAIEGDEGKAEVATTDAAVKTAAKIAAAQAKVAGKLNTASDPETARGKAAAEAAIAEMEKDNRAQEAKAALAFKAAGLASAPAADDASDKASEKASDQASDKDDAAAKEPPAKASAAASGAPVAVHVKAGYGKVDRNIGESDIDGWLSDWPRVRHQWHAFEKLSREEQKKVFAEGFYHYAPYAIFCLMPVFALFLKILYLGSGRRFGEHLLFALHANAFAYLMFIVMLLVHVGIVQFVLWCWLLGYLPWAMRRVYHRSRWGTFMRWSTLMFFYSLSILFAVIASAGMGIMTIH